MIDTDSSKSIRSVGRDMSVSEFLIEDNSVFSIQDKKGPIFITGYERQEETLHSKAFQQTQVSSCQPNMFKYFSMRKISARIRW